MEPEAPLAFAVSGEEAPAVSVVVNFGVFAGRGATPAEIRELGDALVGETGSVTVVAEERHELSAGASSTVQLVRIAVSADGAPADASARRRLESLVVERAERWAVECIARRRSPDLEG